MKKFWLAFIPLTLQAATPGAWETFPTQTNGDAWGLYDYADGMTYTPNWSDDSAAGPNADPYIGAAFASTTANPTIYDQGLWLFADDLVANGAFIGDFNAAGVAGLEVDVFIFNPELLDTCDITFSSNSSGEDITYFSIDYLGSEFVSESPQWWFLNYNFSEPWYVVNAAGTDFEQVEITENILASVIEVGVRFFPTGTNTTSWAPLIDSYALTPLVQAPATFSDADDGMFNLAFAPGPGNQYDIQKYNLTSNDWEDVSGQTDLQPDAAYQFETPLIPEGEIYRVLAKAAYTEVVTPATP